MKILKYVFFASAIIAMVSCDKIDELLTFYISDSSEIVIQSSLSPIDLPFNIPTPDITSDSEEEFKNNNTNSGLVKDVYLSSLNLTIKSPEGTTFSFLKSIKIYIRTDDSNEILLASKEGIVSSESSIDLIPTQSKLDTYVKASIYKLRTEVTTREILTHDVTITYNIRFKVTADPL
jgi:hypothetical protein